ncbi:MAG: hypothetical protein LBP90_06485, partial [Burkholderiales bacterium]|nr:hypothetical protein [Burkholderiales bacterium]
MRTHLQINHHVTYAMAAKRVRKILFCVIALFLGFVGCAKQEDNLAAIPVIEGAYAIGKERNKKEGYYRLDFEIDRNYLDVKVMTFYENYFKSNFWEPVCQDPLQWTEGVSVHFEDPSKSHPIKTLVQVLFNEKEKKFIIIAIRHFGKKLENGNILWDEERQHVMIALNE